ncbi:pantothenate transporter [Stagonosporopsis vannaccii]|nr:pantothenate transporter [Stagonosporopsis vannaccii]
MFHTSLTTVLVRWHPNCHGCLNIAAKESGYSVERTNYLPTCGNAPKNVINGICGITADHTGANYSITVATQLRMVFSNILLTI